MDAIRYFLTLVLEPANLLIAAAAGLLRPWAFFAPKEPLQMPEPIRLYEFENCPFCRLARDAAASLGLEVEIYPCPKGGKRFRPWVKDAGGKTQFPYLVDENTGTAIYESAAIARHFFSVYGRGRVPWWFRLGPLGHLLSYCSTIARPFWGMWKRPSRPPEAMLVLEGPEGSPFMRTVRELLTEMEIAYRWRPIAARPKLVDPNREQSVEGSFAIRRYLITTYGG